MIPAHLPVYAFCESSTATLKAPSSAVNCIFSDPPTDKRCLPSMMLPLLWVGGVVDSLRGTQMIEQVYPTLIWQFDRLQEIVCTSNEILQCQAFFHFE